MKERRTLKNKNVLWIDNVSTLSYLQMWKANRATRSLQEITISLLVLSVLPRIRKKIEQTLQRTREVVSLTLADFTRR